MAKTYINSVSVSVYTETGEFIGKYDNISDTAKANNTSPATVSNAIYGRIDNFALHKFWLKDTDNLQDAMSKHAEIKMRKTKRSSSTPKIKVKKEKPVYIKKDERKGDYIFIESGLSGVECCTRCGLYTAKHCLPCRAEDNHKNGYWRYCKHIEV